MALPEWMEDLLDACTNEDFDPRHNPLTKRERRIAKQLIEDYEDEGVSADNMRKLEDLWRKVR